jgi:hypothetical protein
MFVTSPVELAMYKKHKLKKAIIESPITIFNSVCLCNQTSTY